MYITSANNHAHPSLPPSRVSVRTVTVSNANYCEF